MWGSTSTINGVLQDFCVGNRVYMKGTHYARYILAMSPCCSSVTAVLGLQIRQKPTTKGDNLQKLFFSPNLPKNDKFFLKCTVHLELKLDLAASPLAALIWQSAPTSSSPGCWHKRLISWKKTTTYFIFPSCLCVSLLCFIKRIDEWSILSLQN